MLNLLKLIIILIFNEETYPSEVNLIEQGGNNEWNIDGDVHFDGENAIKNFPISDSQYSYVKVNISLLNSKNLTFYWKVSSEGCCDKFGFCVDKEFGDVGCTRGLGDVTAISGAVDWTKVEYELESGNHTLLWYYAKDGSIASGSDNGWVDNISFN